MSEQLLERRQLIPRPRSELGRLAHMAFVRRDLRRIFDYRRETVLRLLG